MLFGDGEFHCVGHQGGFGQVHEHFGSACFGVILGLKNHLHAPALTVNLCCEPRRVLYCERLPKFSSQVRCDGPACIARPGAWPYGIKVCELHWVFVMWLIAVYSRVF